MTYSYDHRPPRAGHFATPSNHATVVPDWFPESLLQDGVPNLHGYPDPRTPIDRFVPLDGGRFVVNGLTYDARSLAFAEDVVEGDPVEVRVDLSDLSVAWVEDPLSASWHPVRCVQARYARGLPFWAHVRLIEDWVRSGSGTPPWNDPDEGSDFN